MVIVITTEAVPCRCGGQVVGTVVRQCTEVCRTADLEIGWGYVKQVEIVGDDRSTRRNRLGVCEGRCQ
jgi:hypothetical protein